MEHYLTQAVSGMKTSTKKLTKSEVLKCVQELNTNQVESIEKAKVKRANSDNADS